jgi:hypothetical protein
MNDILYWNKNYKENETMSNPKMCPFTNGTCISNCQLFNSNTRACCIPLLNSNLYKLQKKLDQTIDAVNDLNVRIKNDRRNDS